MCLYVSVLRLMFVCAEVLRKSFFGAFAASVAIVLVLYTITPASGQQVNLDSVKHVLTQQEGVAKIQTLIALASARNVVPDSALRYALQAFALAQQVGDKRSIVASEYQLGTLYVQKKSDTLAIQHLRHAIGMAQSMDDAPLIAIGYLKLARYHHSAVAYSKSIEYANQALHIAEEYDLKEQLADAHSRLAASYKSISNYETSLIHCFKALKYYEELKNFEEVARTFSDIGTNYQRTDDLDDALDYFTRAQKMNESIGYTKAVTGNIINIGVIHQKKKNYEEALRCYFQALPMTRKQGDKLREAIVTGNIGSTMVEQGKVAEGLEYLNKALVLKEAVKIPRNILHTLNDVSDARLKLGDARGARAAAERVIAMATQFKESDQLRYGYLNLSKSYKRAGEYEKAYIFLEQHNALNDSLFGIEKAQRIRELEIQYETEKKDMTINSLQQEKQIANAKRKIYFLVGVIVVLILAALAVHQRLNARRNARLLETERQVDRMKSEFFANMSHEFRTPLSLILGPIETLLGKTAQPEHRFQLELMKKNASRLLRLINQILDLSKLQHGSFELKVTAFNAVERVKGVSATFHSSLESKSIALDFQSDDDEIMLYADAEQLETICINLISNAIRFTDHGGKISVHVTRIGAAMSNAGEGVLELKVTDNGAGIPQDKVDHIFDRFYQAGSASEKNYGGTGIGLALTKELVDLHKGSIQVTSVLGKGTTVTIRLPLGKAHFREDQFIRDAGQDVPQQDQPAAVRSEEGFRNVDHEDGGEIEIVAREKPVLLLIEDNADVRAYVNSILETDYILLQAVDGKEGLRHALTFVPDLIISDVMMPGMNGYEVCQRLKRDEKTSHIPVILLTAKASVDSRIEGLEVEADLYLNKPFVPRELMLCINNLIQSRRKLRERYNRQIVLKPSDIAINSMDEQFLQRLMATVETHYRDENFSVEQLSDEMGMSRSQLHRKLQALTNESTSQFIRTFRLQRAMDMLKKRSASISEIAYKVGFSSPSYFNKCFQQQYGCTPSSVADGITADAEKGT